MRYTKLSLDNIRTLISQRGLTERQFCKMFYNKDTHATLKTLLAKNLGVEKLIKVCNLLETNMDSLFELEDGIKLLPLIKGDNNNVNSTVINADLASLKSENETLKLLIKEKDLRISDLQRNLDIVIGLVKVGHNSDERN